MTDDDVQSAVATLLTGRPENASRDEVAERLEVIRRVRGWLAATEVGYTRRARELACTGQSEPAESLLGSAGGMGSKEADTATAREDFCNKTADVEDALAHGDVTATHADAMAAACNGLPEHLRAVFLACEEHLLERARVERIDVFAKRCRRLARQILATQDDDGEDELTRQRNASSIKRWVDNATGMHHTHLTLDPERHATVWAAINGEVNQLRRHLPASEQRSWAQLEIDGLVAAVTNTAAATSSGNDRGRSIPEVQVLTDLATLTSGLHECGIAETIDGVPLPVSTIRRMCCEADIIPTVLDGNGRTLDVGRSKRTATPDQRHALAGMHATCAHPDCQMPFSACRIHHLDWWNRDIGPTDLDNLIPVCERHHHHVHEGGWGLAMTPDRVATWTRPDGTTYWTGSTIDRQQPAA